MLVQAMKRISLVSLSRAAALCALAVATLFATSVTLTSCGGGGTEEADNTLSLSQFKSGSRGILLQAGSAFILRADTTATETGGMLQGYAYPAEMGLNSLPSTQYQATFYGLNGTDPKAPLTGTVKVNVGYIGYSYSKETGFTSFLGFPSAINPQLQLSQPLEITLDMDKHEWKSKIPDGSTLHYNSANGSFYNFGAGSSADTTTEFPQERQGTFYVFSL